MKLGFERFLSDLPGLVRRLTVVIGDIVQRLTAVETAMSDSESSSNTSGIPIGGIISWTSDTSLPIGFLKCEGQAISRSTYSELFAIIGTTFGVGDGSTTFNLPNGQGLVLRGEGTQSINGRTKDGGSLGDKIEDSLQTHFHEQEYNGIAGQQLKFGDYTSDQGSANRRYAMRDTSATTNLSARTGNSIGARTGNETQASSLSVIFIIRAQNLSTADATESAVDALNSRVTDLENKSPVRYIVNTSSSGNNWYEVYNDGWVRQGQYYHQAGGTTYTRTFGVPMLSSAYTLSLSPHMSATSTIQYRSFGHTFLNTGFSGYTGTSTDFISWSCEGFGNSSAVTALGANPNY